MKAFVFPGQGSQKVGMGASLAAASAAARAVFEEVDDALGQSLFSLMVSGPEDELTLTQNAQPAIMANAIATLRVLESEFGIALGSNAEAVAGHSLGEYTALCAAGAFDLATTARLLRLRGEAMQSAVPVGVGAMAALLGADLEKAGALAKSCAQGEVCEIANDNDPGQIVLSGHKSAIERCVASAKEHGIKRAVLLPVSAPFHCSLMAPAAEKMREALSDNPPSAFAPPLYANVRAGRVTDPDEEAALLVEQVTGRVRWRESVIAMRADGIEHFVELGGKVLTPMIGRIDKEAQTTSLVGMEQLEAFAKDNA